MAQLWFRCFEYYHAYRSCNTFNECLCGVGAKSVPTKYQFPTLYGFRDIARTRFYRSRSLQQGQRSNEGQTMTLRNTHPNQCPYQVSTSYTLRFPRYSPDKIFKLKVTTARSKVKSRSDHDVAYLQPLTNVPTKYQLPTPYGFRDIARIRFYRSRSLQQGQIKVRP